MLGSTISLKGISFAGKLLGDEKAIDNVVSVINKVFDKIDGGLDLEDVKYIVRKAKKAEMEEDILEYVCRKHGYPLSINIQRQRFRKY